MTTPPDDADRLLRRLPWAVVIAVAVGLGWYGVTRLVGLPFDGDAVWYVAFAFLAVFVYGDMEPISPPQADPGEGTSAVALEDVILPEERGQPFLPQLVSTALWVALAAFMLGAAAWLLATGRGGADSVTMGLILFGIVFSATVVWDWFRIRRILYVRRLERRRNNSRATE